jgi:hypothetical protein
MDFTTIKSFSDACEVKPADPELAHILSYSGENKHLIAARERAELEHITEVVNGDEQPDFDNEDQDKFCVWMRKEPVVGWVFGYVGEVWHSLSNCGSRLTFTSREKAEYVGRTFGSKYNLIFQ